MEKHTLILSDDCVDLFHARLQLAAHSVGHCVNILKHLALLFQFATHIIGLHAQIANSTEHAIKSLILVVHDLHLLLLLKLRIIVFVFLKGVRIWQHVALLLRILDCLLQRLVHVLDLVANLPDEVSTALHLIDLESELVWVMLDCFHAFHQVLEVLPEVLEGLFKLTAGLAKLWTVC